MLSVVACTGNPAIKRQFSEDDNSVCLVPLKSTVTKCLRVVSQIQLGAIQITPIETCVCIIFKVFFIQLTVGKQHKQVLLNIQIKKYLVETLLIQITITISETLYYNY